MIAGSIMFFDDWKEKSTGLKVSERLLWEYDMPRFDWDGMRTVVMQRVIERGSLNDLYAAIRLYGGIGNIREIIRDIPVLSEKDMNFVTSFFNLKKKELKCYTHRQSREKHLIS
jgi:hypothetical protein